MTASDAAKRLRVAVFYPVTMHCTNGVCHSGSSQHRNFAIWREHFADLSVVAMFDRPRCDRPHSASLDGVKKYSLPVALRGKDLFVTKLPSTVWTVFRLLWRHRRDWDVIVLFEPVLPNQFAFLAAKALGKPVVLRCTGRHDLTVLEGQRSYGQTGRGVLGRLYSRWLRFVQSVMLRSCFVATDGEISYAKGISLVDDLPQPGVCAAFLVESFLRPDAIPHRANPRQPQPGSVRLLSLSRIHPQKGIHLLLEAVVLLDVVGVDCRLDVVGPDYGTAYGSYRARLDRLLVDRGLEGRVTIHGWLPDEQLEELWAQADALVVPCLSNADGVPKVVFEGMVRGIPVIGTRVGGIPRVLDDRETGFLVPPGSAEAIAAAVRELLANPQLAARVAAKGAQRARSCYTATAAAGQFARIVAGARSSPPTQRKPTPSLR